MNAVEEYYKSVLGEVERLAMQAKDNAYVLTLCNEHSKARDEVLQAENCKVFMGVLLKYFKKYMES